MGRRKEYIITKQLTLDDLEKLQSYTTSFKRYGLRQLSDNAFASKLNGLTSIFDFICLFAKVPPPATLASTIIGMVTGMTTSERDTIIFLLERGEDGLQQVLDVMKANPSWTLVELEMPVLEFVDEKFLAPTGDCIINRIQVNGGWIS